MCVESEVDRQLVRSCGGHVAPNRHEVVRATERIESSRIVLGARGQVIREEIGDDRRLVGGDGNDQLTARSRDGPRCPVHLVDEAIQIVRGETRPGEGVGVVEPSVGADGDFRVGVVAKRHVGPGLGGNCGWSNDQRILEVSVDTWRQFPVEDSLQGQIGQRRRRAILVGLGPEPDCERHQRHRDQQHEDHGQNACLRTGHVDSSVAAGEGEVFIRTGSRGMD